MKTPRELILERHRAAEAKLKGIRAEDLASCARSAAVPSSDREPSRLAAHRNAPGCSAIQNTRESCGPLRAGTARGPGDLRQPGFDLSAAVVRFWREALWPWRRAWIGMAAIWIFILGFGVAASEAPKTASSKPPRPDPEALAVLREQKELLTQLLGPAAPPLAAHLHTPGSRSAVEPAPGRNEEAGAPETTLFAETYFQV